MKRIISLLITVCLLFTLTLTSNASSNTIYKQVELNKIHYNKLRSLGFPNETIEFLTPEEILDIVENDFKFEQTNKTINLVVAELEKDISTKVLKTKKIYMIPITEKEIEEYRINKDVFVEEKVIEASVKNDELKSLLSIDIGINKISETVTIDSGVITLWVDIYSSSTDGYIKKTIGTNYRWEDMPQFTLTDAFAVGASGNFWAVYKLGATYFNGVTTKSLVTDYQTAGASAKFNIIFNLCKQTGRVWAQIGNIDSYVPSCDFDIWGGYAHSYIGFTGISVSLDKGLPIFSPSVGTLIKQVSPNPHIVSRTW